MMKRLLPHLLLIASLLVASFAYAEEWDYLMEDVEPVQRYELSKPIRSEPQRLQVVKRLDQEILILRAEMSRKNGDVRQVEQYVRQLDKQYIIPPFKQRVAALKQYLATTGTTKSGVRYFNVSQKITFPMNDPNAVVAIVLPVSGSYASAGAILQQSLEAGLQRAGFAGKLIALDSAIYDSTFEIWEVLKYYDPDFVFGPLEKQRVQDWQRMDINVPTLFFNDVSMLGVGEFSLSPNKQAGLEQVFQILNQAQYQKLLVLKNNSEVSQGLENAFYQAWLNLNSAQDYIPQVIDKNVGLAIDDGLNVKDSKARHRWLQTILNERLEFSPRARKDLEAVISFVPQNQAIQIAPYLHFLALDRELTHIWYPSKTPSASYLQANIDAWQQTFAVLPLSLSSKKPQNSRQSTRKFKNGLFYALGQVAIEIVNNPAMASSVDSLVETAYGTFVRNASGQFHLLPVVYWADNGVFENYNTQAE